MSDKGPYIGCLGVSEEEVLGLSRRWAVWNFLRQID